MGIDVLRNVKQAGADNSYANFIRPLAQGLERVLPACAAKQFERTQFIHDEEVGGKAGGEEVVAPGQG